MSRKIASLIAIVGLAALLPPSTASADPATAEALFREGRRLLDVGKTDEACMKLAESQAQDPSSGTLLNLGLCHETQHKLATAWSDYLLAARLARSQGKEGRAAVAEKKAMELEPRLPRLTVTATAPVAGLQIQCGADNLGPGGLGTAVPLDPGSYVVTATAPGRRPWTTAVDLGEAESKSLQVPELEVDERPVVPTKEPAPAPPPAAVAPVALAPAPAVGPAPASGRGGWVGWTVSALGVAAAAVGAGFGVASLQKYQDANGLCPSPHQNCTAAAMSARSSAESMAWVCNVAIGIGVVGAGIGGWILVANGRTEARTKFGLGGTPGAPGIALGLERGF